MRRAPQAAGILGLGVLLVTAVPQRPVESATAKPVLHG